MANEMGGGNRGIPWRIIGWGTAAMLLFVPYLVKAPWTSFDYIFAGVIFGTVGLAFELVVQRSHSIFYRLGAALAVVALFLTVWVNGAVGMIGNEDNPYNLVFDGVLLIALAGAIVARLQARGMVVAMGVTALAQMVAGGFGLTSDLRGAIFSIGFGGMWALAALLFWNAAREQATTATA